MVISISCKKEVKIQKDEKLAIVKDSVSFEEKFWNPSQTELDKVSRLLDKLEKDGKFEFVKKSKFKSYKDYYIQYFCLINERGEKIIFVNAMCEIGKTTIVHYKNGLIGFKEFEWKKYFQKVYDGGSCHWQISINISKNTYGLLNVNGYA